MALNSLVSIIVITYNSSKFVLETLESIKKQTYQEIELIISDDSSSDDTVEVCKNWIENNEWRFKSTEILTTEKNKGVSANCNRGILSSKGVWIKIIAGDDCLFPDCIEKYMLFVHGKDILICHSKAKAFRNKFVDNNVEKMHRLSSPVFIGSELSSDKQFKSLCLINIISAPTVFINRKLFELVGMFDESILMCEDWPMWLKITSKGYAFFYLDEYTVKYRIHNESICGKESPDCLFKLYKFDSLVYKQYISSTAPMIISFAQRYDYYLKLILNYWGLNRNNKLCYCIYKMFDIPFLMIYRRTIRG